jgi:hypothetical protein
MPPSSEHYINSVIYTIQHKEIPELLYVGSTSSFSIRFKVHKNNCNNPNSQQYYQKLYEIIRKNGGWNAFEMSIYKKNPCYNKDALLMVEDKVIDELKPLLNKNRAFLTVAQKKQYQIDYKKKNKEKLYKYYRLWTIANNDKEKQKEYNRLYYITTKEKRKEKYLENKLKSIN